MSELYCENELAAFSEAPCGRRVAEGLYELRRPTRDLEGNTWTKGTTYSGHCHGNRGFTVRIDQGSCW